MSQQTANSRFINNSARCIYLYPNGRRCRLTTTNANPNFCPAHAPLPANQPDAAEIASTLTVNLDDFTSAAQINDFLSRLLLLLAQDKISTAAPPSSPTSPTNSSVPCRQSPRRKIPKARPSSSICPAPTATALSQTKIRCNLPPHQATTRCPHEIALPASGLGWNFVKFCLEPGKRAATRKFDFPLQPRIHAWQEVPGLVS